jgi:dTDP-4-amino-4,6-dideoxygalactose transaminase
MAAPGLNYRASDIACALGRSQLAKLGRFVTARAALMTHYAARMARLGTRARLLALSPASQPAWHLAVALVPFDQLGLSRAEVMAGLAARGIGSQVHYLPLHRQAYWRALEPELQLPGADRYYARCLSLPLYPSLTLADVDRVIDALDAVLTPRIAIRRAS